MTADQVLQAAARIVADSATTEHCENVEALDVWAAAVADTLVEESKGGGQRAPGP